MRPRRFAPLLAAVLPLAFAAGCSRSQAPAVEASRPPSHHHHAPHGGTPVVLGEEEYHVELVLDQAAGELQAYVLDDEMENFVRIGAPSIVITATVAGTARELVLDAVPNTETGETVGDTALFEAQADWLKSAPRFDGVLRSVTVRGTTYTAVPFNFPRGNDPDG